ncbi:MAG: response regulator transcription factor [Verrucomicrobiota bacterium]
MTRILLADDHDIIRRGVKELLETHDGWQVVGEASTGRQAVELAGKLHPDIAILDLTMPELNGLEATRQIKKTLPKTAVLIFTMHENENLIRDVLTAGALGYVLKSDAARHLTNAVEALIQHKPFFSAKVSEAVLDGYLKAGREESPVSDPLTPREREIVQLLAEGKSNKEAADSLSISTKTIETHRATIMRKLELKSFAEMVRYAIRNNIIQP